MGQKYAALATAGHIEFYDSADSPVPDGVQAIEITDEEWVAALTSGANGAPYTIINSALVAPAAPTDAQLLEASQSAQVAILNAAYQAAINAPVSFTTAAGSTAAFNQDATAKSNLQEALLASEKGAAWPINLWLSAAGTPISPFTYADLQGLAAAMEAVDAPDYQKLLTLIGQVTTATTVAGVQAVVWS